MTDQIIGLIKDFISSSAGTLSSFFEDLFYYVFYIEEQLGDIDFNGIYKTIYAWALIILIIMFVKKMIQTYFLFKSGEEDQSPVRVIVGLLEAVIIMITFGWIYTYVIKIGYSLYKQILDAVGIQGFDVNDLTDAASNGLFAAVCSIIIAGQLLGVFWQLLKRGLEILILRCTMPFFCIGLLNANAGAFGVVMKKFMQNFFTVIMQLILLFIAMKLCSNEQYIYTIAVLMLAIAPQQFLQEFMAGIAGMGIGAMASKALQMEHYGKGALKTGISTALAPGRGIGNFISGGAAMAAASWRAGTANEQSIGRKVLSSVGGFALGSAKVVTGKMRRSKLYTSL